MPALLSELATGGLLDTGWSGSETDQAGSDRIGRDAFGRWGARGTGFASIAAVAIEVGGRVESSRTEEWNSMGVGRGFGMDVTFLYDNFKAGNSIWVGWAHAPPHRLQSCIEIIYRNSCKKSSFP